MRKIPKHDWHMFDFENKIQIRQITNRFRKNQFELKNANGDLVLLSDEEFSRIRKGQLTIF